MCFGQRLAPVLQAAGRDMKQVYEFIDHRERQTEFFPSLLEWGMDLRISSTFTESLAKLTGDEQKAVKTTAFDLQLNPASPGMQFHKLDKARDKNFWSVRVSSDIRLIVHRTATSLLLCYVDHHDRAYAWAERAQAANASEDRGCTVGRNSRDGSGDCGPHLR